MAYGKLKAEVKLVAGEARLHAIRTTLKDEKGRFRIALLRDSLVQATFVIHFMEAWDARKKNIKKYLLAELKKKGRESETNKIYSQMKEKAREYVKAALREKGLRFAKDPDRFKVGFTEEVVSFLK